MTATYTLRLSCPDRPGLVARVAGFLASAGGNIVDAQQFDDRLTGSFFMRVVFEMPGDEDPDSIRAAFAAVGSEIGAEWQLRGAHERQKVLLLVSKFDHCLGDLLYRYRIGELDMDVVGIVSNHPKRSLHITMIGDIPFHHLPVTKETKPEQEAAIKRIVTETGADLDEGPIIAQDAEPVSHADTPDDLVRKGRDIERRVLAAAVTYHLQDRVLLNGSRTVVFR